LNWSANAERRKVMAMRETMAPYPVVPVPNDWTRPFFDGAKEHKLMIQRCQSCGYYNHPPVFLCQNCKDRDATLAFEQVSGRGTIYSYIIEHDKQVGGFEDKVPYAVVLVELEEQERLLLFANILNLPYDELKAGTPVEVVFERVNDEITIPQFQPARK